MLNSNRINDFFIGKYNAQQEKVLDKVVKLGLDFIDGKLRDNKILKYRSPCFFLRKYRSKTTKREN